MGLFSKLFGKAVEDAAESMFGSEKHYFDNLREDDKPQPVSQRSSVEPPKPKGEQPRGNLPWGDIMPAEENQYSFSGNYIQYFEKIFSEEFPSYQITHEPAPKWQKPGEIFTFMNAGRRVLVVELMSEKCSAKKLKYQCRNEGVPYLRFYYDHHGWWNARSYVAGRVRSALSV